MASIKKHVRHMTKTEFNTLWKMAKDVKYWKATGYSIKRLQERGGTVEDVLDTLNHGNLIEYHRRNGNHRILIRGTKRYGRDVICAVFDLSRRAIVTAYWNRYDDNHYTLNESAYNRHLDVMKELGA